MKCAEIYQTHSTGIEPLAFPSRSQHVLSRQHHARGWEEHTEGAWFWGPLRSLGAPMITQSYHWEWQRQENLSREPQS